MHIQIPKRFPFVQHYLMYPWVVYELSFVPSIQKFESLVRPKGSSRRKEYVPYLLLSSIPSFYPILEQIISIMGISNKVSPTIKNIGSQFRNYYCYLNEYNKLPEEMKGKIRFEEKLYFVFENENQIEQKELITMGKRVNLNNIDECLTEFVKMFHSLQLINRRQLKINEIKMILQNYRNFILHNLNKNSIIEKNIIIEKNDNEIIENEIVI